MRVEFELESMPVTQQQKGITKNKKGKLTFYNRKGTSNYELQKALIERKPKQPIPKETPTKARVVFTYASKQKKRWGEFKTTKPDCDNLMKNLQDYMTKFGYYTDDNQLVHLDVQKFWGEKNKIEIELTEAQK